MLMPCPAHRYFMSPPVTRARLVAGYLLDRAGYLAGWQLISAHFVRAGCDTFRPTSVTYLV